MRTKHQTFLTAQLRVDAKSAEPTTTTITASAAPAGPATPGGGEEKSTAKDMPLNDADLLEAVRFAGNVEDANLKVIDQAILLAFWYVQSLCLFCLFYNHATCVALCVRMCASLMLSLRPIAWIFATITPRTI